MSVEFQDAQTTFSQSLDQVANSLTGEKVTLSELLGYIGEQGMLLACMLLMVPFLFPVSIPGVSTVFSVVVIFTGFGVTLNRIPWLPSFVLKREFATEGLVNALKRGSKMMGRIDRIIHPRWKFITASPFINRVHGLAFIFAGVLLIAPLGLVPFSNTLPALAVLFLAAGLIQRDGLFLILGYVMIIISVIYFGALVIGVLAAGDSLSKLLGS
ncbi:MAG: exopolysaccharide biosynthesis protein [bacterium]|nr:exopolysaccharide biosynthesis protein [bacterium]